MSVVMTEERFEELLTAERKLFLLEDKGLLDLEIYKNMMKELDETK